MKLEQSAIDSYLDKLNDEKIKISIKNNAVYQVFYNDLLILDNVKNLDSSLTICIRKAKDFLKAYNEKSKLNVKSSINSVFAYENKNYYEVIITPIDNHELEYECIFYAQYPNAEIIEILEMLVDEVDYEEVYEVFN